MRRERGSSIITRVSTESAALSAGPKSGLPVHMHGCPDHLHPDVAFNKLSIVNDIRVIAKREREQLANALSLATSSGEHDMVTHIQSCLRELDAQDAELSHLEPLQETDNAGLAPGGTEAAQSLSASSHETSVGVSTTDRHASVSALNADAPVFQSAFQHNSSRTRVWVGGELHDAYAEEGDDTSNDSEEREGGLAPKGQHAADVYEHEHSMSEGAMSEQGHAILESDMEEVLEAFNELDAEGGAAAVQKGKAKIESVEGVFFFYQTGHGQRIFMHPLNMRCLLEVRAG
jgi:hypothetical protein